MTVTVQAGITVAKLQALLAKENQWLPVDVPNLDRATIGGAVAANSPAHDDSVTAPFAITSSALALFRTKAWK